VEQNQNTNNQIQPKEIPPSDDDKGAEPIIPETSISTSAEGKEETPPLQTDAMEVHKHPHHVMHKKKWTEYVLEFFMLFLAVFLGFIAENIRERSVEKHREKQYLFSLVEDLKEDTQLLEHQIASHRTGVAMMDSFSAILTRPELVRLSGDQLYYFGRRGPRLGTFSANVRTFEQLKNSGNFRLITDAETSSRIMSYYERIPSVQQLEAIYADEFSGYKKLAAQIFEPAVFMNQETETGNIVRTTNNPPLQTTDSRLLKQLAIYVIYMNGSRKAILALDEKLLEASKELIGYLQKTYHLENK